MPDTPPAPDSADSLDSRHADRRRGEQRRLQRALWLGSLSLLLAVGAIAATLVIGWRTLGLEAYRTADSRVNNLERQDAQALQQRIAALEANDAATRAALAALQPLPAQIGNLGGRVGTIEARIEAPQRAVARVEAAHLVDLAHHRLTLERDVRGAGALLAAADARLAASGDPGAARIRSQLKHDIDALGAVRTPDQASLAGRLAAAEAAVRTLPMVGAIQSSYRPPGSEVEAPPGIRRAWQRFTTSFSDVISVRRVSQATVEIVSMEEIGVRRHHLQTLLFAARLGALRTDEAEYHANLDAARDWLHRFFDSDEPATARLMAELNELSAARVSPDLPDVSGSLKLLSGPSP
jgi:uroporphyrin-3 C-methyltransferase